MKTDLINKAILTNMPGSSGSISGSGSEKTGSPGFLDMLSSILQDVNQTQVDASQSATDLALGDENYLHNTMIAYEKANLALQLVIEVRNKLVEAYQEIMRIQV